MNFNAHVLLREAPRLEQSQVIAMSRATERRAKALVANKLQVKILLLSLIQPRKHNHPNSQDSSQTIENRQIDNHTCVPSKDISMASSKQQVNSSCVTDLIIWGHASAPDAVHADLSRAQVHKYDGAVVGPDWFALPVTSLICDEKWLETEFPQQLAGE